MLISIKDIHPSTVFRSDRGLCPASNARDGLSILSSGKGLEEVSWCAWTSSRLGDWHKGDLHNLDLSLGEKVLP